MKGTVWPFAIAVLCHDLGKGYTKPEDLPNHHGHEQQGLAHVDRLLARWPGLRRSTRAVPGA
jgi:tRNA nucleotidyltransferase (CCA-adding enzyme)